MYLHAGSLAIRSHRRILFGKFQIDGGNLGGSSLRGDLFAVGPVAEILFSGTGFVNHAFHSFADIGQVFVGMVETVDQRRFALGEDFAFRGGDGINQGNVIQVAFH